MPISGITRIYRWCSNGLCTTHTWLQIAKYVACWSSCWINYPWWLATPSVPQCPPSVLCDATTLSSRWSNQSVVQSLVCGHLLTQDLSANLTAMLTAGREVSFSLFFSPRPLGRWVPVAQFDSPSTFQPLPSMSNKFKLSLIWTNYGKLLGLFYDDVF